MTGNVWEWTHSEHRSYHFDDPVDGREDKHGRVEKRFAVCGDSWDSQPISLRAPYHVLYAPVLRNFDLGVRLARHLPRVKG